MICIDNSEFSRNSDYAPSRLEAQTDAANVVCGAKTQQHPENVVGVAFMSGDRVDVRLSPSNDIGRVLAVLSEVPVVGVGCDLVRSIQTCSIALKHRQNKNQKQRLVCFVASPLLCTEKQMEQLGKVLKKNNVAIDIISIGDIDGSNRPKLKKLVDCADSAGSSHFVQVDVNSGQHVTDVVISSPILQTEGEVAGDFDANMDPELAMAIRLSMEEERLRQGPEAPASETFTSLMPSCEPRFSLPWTEPLAPPPRRRRWRWRTTPFAKHSRSQWRTGKARLIRRKQKPRNRNCWNHSRELTRTIHVSKKH